MGSHSLLTVTRKETPMEKYVIDGEKNGLALIINNNEFAGKPRMQRLGSEKDVERLKQMLAHLNFKVTFEENLKKTDFVTSNLKFTEKLENNDVDVCFVCIMSHGADDGVILSADLKLINIEHDILDRFNNKYCKAMRGKPKVFLFLACRGRDKDKGVIVLNPTGSSSAAADSLPPTKMITEQLNDSFVAFSTTPHHVSYRAKDGSPFITITCQVLKDEAHRMHLQDMFTLIKMKMDAVDIGEDENRCKIVMETTSRLGKHLYFLQTSEDRSGSRWCSLL